MNVKVEHVEKNKVCLEVEVDSDKVNAAINTAVRSLSQRVKVPGFRRGRVPRNILELTLGKEAILDEALQTLVPEAYSQALVEQDVEPIDKPQVEVVKIEENAPLVFKATVEVKPEVTLGEYKGLKVTKEKVTITEEEVETILKNLQERAATFVVAEDEPAAVGDLIMVDYTATIDGQEFEGSKAENMPMVVGAPGYYPGLSQSLEGTKKGETKEVKITLPADFRVTELAGKEAVFNVEVKEVHKKRLAAIDDEFAKDVSEFNTLEELKTNIESRLLEAKKQQVQEKMEEQLLNQIVEQAKVEVPEIMIKRRAHTMLHNFAHELEHRGLTLQTYCELKETTQDKVEQEFFPLATKSVKQELVLDAIAKKENITVEPEKVEAALDELATGLKDPDQAKQRWSEDGTREVIENSLIREETLAFLLQEAIVTEVEPSDSEAEEVNEAANTEESKAEATDVDSDN